jgi:3-methyladenine DNA glycosylase AlkD
MIPKAVQVALTFVDKINQGDSQGVIALLAPDTTYVDLEGNIERGKEILADCWQGYLSSHFKYQIYIHRIFEIKNGVVLIGHTTGSHLKFPEDKEFHEEGRIWLFGIKDGLIESLQLYQDTVENELTLELKGAEEVYAPAWFAATIAKHLDLLPPGSRTDDVRNVRKFYSHLYRKAQPETMLAIAESLFFDQGYRFVPYELIHYHKGAIEKLTPEKVEQLGEGIHDWASADTFAQFISGPAWKAGVIDDDFIEKWLNSPDFWYRRIAVVSTIYLDGDPERMLRYTQALVDDKEDMIVKAVSWVLRRAIKYDREGVERFLDKNRKHLASRIKREVRNKLETGLKNPR